jgi:hypothetical protein
VSECGCQSVIERHTSDWPGAGWMYLGYLGEVENTNGRDVVDSSFLHRIPRCEFNDPHDTDISSCTGRDCECVCADVRMGGWAAMC